MAVTDAKSNSSASQTLIAIVRKRSEAVLSSLVVSLVGLVSQESTRLLVLNEGRWSRCCKHAKTDTLMGHWIMNELVEAAPIRRTHTGDNSPMLSRRFSRFFFFWPIHSTFLQPFDRDKLELPWSERTRCCSTLQWCEYDEHPSELLRWAEHWRISCVSQACSCCRFPWHKLAHLGIGRRRLQEWMTREHLLESFKMRIKARQTRVDFGAIHQ